MQYAQPIGYGCHMHAFITTTCTPTTRLESIYWYNIAINSTRTSYLTADRMKKIPEHQPTPVCFRIGNRHKSHVVSDLPLHTESMSQRKIRPVRLNGPMVFRAATAATLPLPPAQPTTTTPSSHGFQKLFV